MLAAEHRLRRSADFDRTVKSGRRRGRRTLVVHLLIPDQRGAAGTTSRAGFVVSRAVGGAVVRSLVKRRLRAAMSDRLALLPNGSDVVIRANPAAARASFPALVKDLDAALLHLLPRSPVTSPVGDGTGA